MSDDPEQPLTEEPEQRAEQLTDELARKYDPDRLLRMVSKRAGKGESLDHSVRAKYERRFGVDLGHVRIYSGEFAEEFNRQRSAYAVTIGSTGMILMGGSPDRSMASASGQALLAHELTHVAQAKRGLHNKNFAGAMPLATEDHEQEAEEEEAMALAGEEGAASGGDAAADAAGAAKGMSKEDMAKTLEKIRDRVYEMAADAARSQYARSGVARRP